MLACRLCRVPLSAARGCAVCDDVRKHLVAVDEDGEGDTVALSVVGTETVSALRAQLKYLKRRLQDNEADEHAGKSLLGVANSVAKVLESARKLQADGVTALANMSFPERANLFISWYADLPPAYRTQLREKLEQWELEEARPLKQLPEGVQ